MPLILYVKEAPPWDIKKGFDIVGDGRSYTDNVTFAHFGPDPCFSGGSRAFTTNGLSLARLVPMHFTSIKWHQTAESHKAYMHPPRPDFIRSTDCGAGRVCEAQKQNFFQDVDGTLLGGKPNGAVISRAYNDDGAIQPGCTVKEDWNAVHCEEQIFGTLTVKSLDDDSTHRNILPLRMEKEDGSIQLVNQPPDMYLFTEWPSFVRPSVFFPTVRTGRTYKIDFGDLNPKNTFFQLTNCRKGERVVLEVFYYDLLRLELWSEGKKRFQQLERPNVTTGENLDVSYSKETRRISFLLECEAPAVELHQLMVLRLTARLDMELNTFLDAEQDVFMGALALLLEIDPSTIRIVEVRAGSIIVVTEIEDSSASEPGYNATTSALNLQALGDKLQAAVESGELEAAVPGMTVMEIQKPVTPMEAFTAVQDQNVAGAESEVSAGGNDNLALGLGVGAGVLVIGALAGIWLLRQRKQKKQRDFDKKQAKDSIVPGNGKKAVRESWMGDTVRPTVTPKNGGTRTNSSTTSGRQSQLEASRGKMTPLGMTASPRPTVSPTPTVEPLPQASPLVRLTSVKNMGVNSVHVLNVNGQRISTADNDTNDEGSLWLKNLQSGLDEAAPKKKKKKKKKTFAPSMSAAAKVPARLDPIVKTVSAQPPTTEGQQDEQV
jgi:hypothetical protein